jgi:hypothetical protein
MTDLSGEEVILTDEDWICCPASIGLIPIPSSTSQLLHSLSLLLQALDLFPFPVARVNSFTVSPCSHKHPCTHRHITSLCSHQCWYRHRHRQKHNISSVSLQTETTPLVLIVYNPLITFTLLVMAFLFLKPHKGCLAAELHTSHSLCSNAVLADGHPAHTCASLTSLLKLNPKSDGSCQSASAPLSHLTLRF